MRWLALTAIFWVAACQQGCQQDKGLGRTDSESHWMQGCLASEECGDLSCLCGVCTAPCDTAICGELGGECSIAPLCEAAEALCVRAEDQPSTMDMTGPDAATFDAAGPDTGVPDAASPDLGAPPVGECANPDSECQVDGACGGAPCSALYPASPCVCVPPVAPRVVPCVDGCCDSAQCEGAARCQGAGLDAQDALCGEALEPADNACAPERCNHDVDCGVGQTCIRPGEWGHVRSACVLARCTEDAQCDARAGGQCLGFFTPCYTRGFACAYPDDPCRADADCPDRGGPRVCLPVEGGGTECVAAP
jgi:hypothetical protein